MGVLHSSSPLSLTPFFAKTESYLSSRYQRTKIEAKYITREELQTGVPQGSASGPLLFTICIYIYIFYMKPHSFVLRIIYFLHSKTQEKQQPLRFAYSFLNDGTFIYRALYTIILFFTLLKIIHYYRHKNPIIKIHNKQKPK